jgi:hypothetical protein
MTVQVLRQAPVVLLTKLGHFSLIDRARMLSMAMMTLPALLAASCWFIAPRGQKGWALFPIFPFADRVWHHLVRGSRGSGDRCQLFLGIVVPAVIPH